MSLLLPSCITHILAFICEAIPLSEHEQDVSIMSERARTFRMHAPVFILVPLQEHEVGPKLKKMCVSVP